jgi:hypothetical protein
MPDLIEIVNKPAYGGDITIGKDEGIQANFAYTYQRVPQTLLTADYGLKLPSAQVAVVVQPRFIMHHLMSTEIKYRKKEFGVWASLTRDIPDRLIVRDGWLSTPVGTAWVGGTGVEWRPQEYLNFDLSWVSIREQPDNQRVANPSLASVDFDLPNRYPFANAFQLRGGWTINDEWRGDLKFLHETDQNGTLSSFDIHYRPQNSHFTVGLGLDWFQGGITQSWFKQFQGDERLRASVQYVF